MLLFAIACLSASTLSALALRKLWLRKPMLGGDLFWISTTTYLWFLAVAQAMVMWPARHAVLDRAWLLAGGGLMVLVTFAYSETSWPPFEGLRQP
jgi:hypothetical protein